MDASTEEPRAKRSRVTQTITELLPHDILKLIVKFIGTGNYRYVAGTCHDFKKAYDSTIADKKTTYKNAAVSVPCASLCIMEVSLSYKGCVKMNKEAKAEKEISATAGQRGNISVLDWLLERNATGNVPYFSRALEEAIRNDHIHVLDWMKEKKLPHDYGKVCWLEAAACGKLHALHWLSKNRSQFQIEPRYVYKAALLGQNKVLERSWYSGWLSHRQKRVAATAAFGGQLESLKLLRQWGCKWDANVVYWAEQEGHVEVAEWARNNGCSTFVIGMYTRKQLSLKDE